MATTAGVLDTEERNKRARDALKGAFVGFYVDLFDIYLPIVVLAPAIIYFVSPEMSASATAIVSASIFAATLVGRPVGAAIFGHFADTIGRKRTAIISVAGFGAATLLIALLPGYEQWGITAVILLIALRFIDGIFLGGEYTSANPLAMEYAPREKRGLYSGIIDSAFPLAYASISLITLFLLFLLPSEGVNSPYVQWGWRIPFVIGAVLAFAFVVYYARTVSESELWQHSEKPEAPLKSLFRGENLRSFLQVFLLMNGLWLTLQTVAAVLPGVLAQTGLSSTQVTVTLVVAYLVLAPVIVAAGALSQVTGRRRFLMVVGAIMATLATALYYLIISGAVSGLLWVIVLTSVLVSIVVCPFALTPAYVSERFHVGVRASGYGLAYSLAVVLPSFYAFYQAGLSVFMPFEYTVLALLVVGSLLIAVGAAWGPETKDVEFTAAEHAP